MLQKVKYRLLWIAFIMPASVSASADPQTDELLNILKTPVAEYQLDTKPYVIDPKIAKRQYEVSWLIPPLFRISAQEYQGWRQPAKIEMTVEAGTGLILQSRTLKSSGSLRADQKIHDALQNAKLQSIPMVEKTMRYTLIHEFKADPP